MLDFKLGIVRECNTDSENPKETKQLKFGNVEGGNLGTALVMREARGSP